MCLDVENELRQKPGKQDDIFMDFCTVLSLTRLFSSKAHWKILLENIKMAQEQHASRKLEEKKGKAGIGTDGKEKSDSDGKGKSAPLSDTKDFKGLRIKADKAFVTFGLIS